MISAEQCRQASIQLLDAARYSLSSDAEHRWHAVHQARSALKILDPDSKPMQDDLAEDLASIRAAVEQLVKRSQPSLSPHVPPIPAAGMRELLAAFANQPFLATPLAEIVSYIN